MQTVAEKTEEIRNLRINSIPVRITNREITTPHHNKNTMRIPVRIIPRYPAQNMTQNGPYFSNLVNIQIVNSRENTLSETTKEHVPKPLSDMQR